MIIPVPLCAILAGSYSGCFVKMDGFIEVESSFHDHGLRIGDQSGHYGAHISTESDVAASLGLNNLKMQYPGNPGTPIDVNSVSPTGFDRFTWSNGNPVWDNPYASGNWVSYCWQDSTYQYVASGVFSLDLTWTKRAMDCDVSWSSKASFSVIRAKLSDIAALSPGNTSYIRFCRLQTRLANGNWSTSITEKKPLSWDVSGQITNCTEYDFRPLWGPSTVQSALQQLAGLAVANPENRWTGEYNQWCYMRVPLDSRPDYTSLFDTLLHTYEFNDPLLAKGLVARQSHTAIRTFRDGFGKDAQRNIIVQAGHPFGDYKFEWLVQHAWMDAVSAIPKANDNSIQNVIEAAKLLIALKNGDITEIPDILYDAWKRGTANASAAADTIRNLWMGYRYQYCTTKMDVEEYADYALRVIERNILRITSSRCHGHARLGDYNCNCSMTWSEKGLSGLSKFFHKLWETGLEPNGYVLWDFVPFSFVADWFYPVGDTLKVYSDKQYLNSGYYQFSDIVFSIRYRTGPIAGMTADHFVRWVASEPPEIDESYWFDSGDTSTGVGTSFKRIVDSGCLISGIASSWARSR